MWKWIGALDRLLRGEQTRSPTLLAALLVPVAGAVGSVSLMLRAGHRNDSRILLALFAIWVLSPFVALVLANLISTHWSAFTRATLHCVMLILTLGSLAIYANMVSTPTGSKLAVPFLVVPLGSWLLITIVIPMAALLSRRLSRFRPVRWLIKAVAAVVMLCVLGITVLLGLLLLDHNRDTTLPTPSGPFAVGRTTFGWSDASQADRLAPQRGTKREFLPGFGIPHRLHNRHRLLPSTCPLHGGRRWRVACCSRYSPEICRGSMHIVFA